MTVRVESHILARLESAQTHSDPYPYIEVTDFLPSDIYSILVDHMPAEEHYDSIMKFRVENKRESTRFRCSLQEENLQCSTSEARNVWLAVRNAMGAPTVKRSVFRTLCEGLSFRFGVEADEVGDIPAFPLTELYREKAGYSIKPHPDTRKKVVTLQLALPRDDSQSAMGTSLYRRYNNPLRMLSEGTLFEEIGRAQFLPNRVFAFSVINQLSLKSWHGCERLPESCGPRNTLLQIYYADPINADPEVYEMYYRDLRAA